MMHGQIDARLRQLRAEYESGQRVLAELESKKLNVQQVLLRIAGAIQVLEELLGSEQQDDPTGSGTPADSGNTP